MALRDFGPYTSSGYSAARPEAIDIVQDQITDYPGLDPATAARDLPALVPPLAALRLPLCRPSARLGRLRRQCPFSHLSTMKWSTESLPGPSTANQTSSRK